MRQAQHWRPLDVDPLECPARRQTWAKVEAWPEHEKGSSHGLAVAGKPRERHEDSTCLKDFKRTFEYISWNWSGNEVKPALWCLQAAKRNGAERLLTQDTQDILVYI